MKSDPLMRAALVCATLIPLSAQAQIMPGTLPPESAAEAIDEAQSLLCTLAAAGRPMPGLNMPMLGSEGMTQLAAIPDALARFVPPAPGQMIVRITVPGDPVWVVHDPRTGRCAIYSFTEAAPVEAKLIAGFERTDSWKKRKDAGAGVAHAYEWKMDRTVRLRTEISLPAAPGSPLMVVVRPAKG